MERQSDLYVPFLVGILFQIFNWTLVGQIAPITNGKEKNPKKTCKVSVEMLADDWLCQKME